jgi:glucose-6-phosphate 1-dehydrogenase
MLPETAFIIFGATGDLTKRKLIPALYRLHCNGKLHPKSTILAIGRREYDDSDIRKELKEFIKDTKQWDAFSKRISYHKLEFHDPTAYDALARKLSKAQNRLFYLATGPASFPLISKHLHRTGIAQKKPQRGWHRVAFEKPFGSDLKSARELNREIMRIFEERQVYRIDHYLGKDLVQNILVLRFTNAIFEKLWSKEYIDNIQIVILESVGVGSRGGYYEHAGALRDMVQSHLLQMLALSTMEIPKSLDPDHIRNRKVEMLRKIKLQPLNQVTKNMVIGQYTKGKMDGKEVPSYTDEKDVPKDSKTETFVAVKLEADSKRWEGVPFYLRTGKALMHHYAEIVITFKQMDCRIFCGSDGKLAENKLVIRIQPDEGVKLQFNIKAQATDELAVPYTMDYSYMPEFGMNTSEAYERLLSDIMTGDQTLFTRWDEVEQAWRITDHLRKAKPKLLSYPAGSHGPHEALEMLKKENRDWYGDIAVRQFK